MNLGKIKIELLAFKDHIDKNLKPLVLLALIVLLSLSVTLHSLAARSININIISKDGVITQAPKPIKINKYKTWSIGDCYAFANTKCPD